MRWPTISFGDHLPSARGTRLSSSEIASIRVAAPSTVRLKSSITSSITHLLSALNGGSPAVREGVPNSEVGTLNAEPRAVVFQFIVQRSYFSLPLTPSLTVGL